MEIKLQKRYKYAGDIFEALTAKAGFPIEVAVDLLNSINDADVAPVVHGEWIESEWRPKCSVCGHTGSIFDSPTSPFNFCPNCGARMDEKDGE